MTMQALIWTGPRAMSLQTVPAPALADDGVLIDVRAVGICGSELGGYLGHNSLRVPPLIMGHEAAGVVSAVSDGARFADGSCAVVGARVAFNPLITCGSCEYCLSSRENLCPKRRLIGAHVPGAFAQRVGVPARLCYPVPADLLFATAALAEPLACALRAVETAALSPGQTLVILGAGPIGLLCLRAAIESGVERVLISDIDERRLALARAWGATMAANALNQDVVATAKSFTAHGPHAVIDAVGSDATRAQAISMVKPGGRAVLIGLHAETSPFAANYVIRQEINIAGTFGYVARNYAAAVGLLIGKRIAATSDWVAQRPLADGRASFEELISGNSPYAKIVLVPPH